MIYKCVTEYEWSTQRHLMVIRRHDLRSRSSQTLKWSWEDHEPGMQVSKESLGDFDEFEVKAFLQACLDQAWAAGLRPAHYQDDDKQLKATQYHLEDMRSIAFGKDA